MTAFAFDADTFAALSEIAARGTAHVDSTIVAWMLSAALIERPAPRDPNYGTEPWALSAAGARVLVQWRAQQQAATRRASRQPDVIPISRERRDCPF